MAIKITATGPLADGENLVTIKGVVPGFPFGVRYLCARVVDGQLVMFYQYDDANEVTVQVLVHVLENDDALPPTDAWVDTVVVVPAGPSGTTGVGDFCAVNTDPVGLPTTPVVMTPPTIQSGNAGDWYDPATGRYTPPPGRYFLHATVTAGSSMEVAGIQVNLRKNGSPISAPGIQVASAGTYSGDPANAATVDANGTDFFDFTCFASGNASSTLIQFLAFPLSSVGGAPKGPSMPEIRHVSAAAAM
jgi:hypothetical protein